MFCQPGIEEWDRKKEAHENGLASGRIFRALNKDGQLAGRVKTKGGGWADGNLTPQAIYV